MRRPVINFAGVVEQNVHGADCPTRQPGDRPAHRARPQEVEERVDVVVEIADRVVAFGQQANRAALAESQHFAPVEHLVALGDDGEKPLGRGGMAGCPCAQLGFHGPQLFDVFGLEEKAFARLVPAGLLANVLLQVARREHRRVIGVKASGGIRSLADAQAMIAAGANRIGTSASVAILAALAE